MRSMFKYHYKGVVHIYMILVEKLKLTDCQIKSNISLLPYYQISIFNILIYLSNPL